jgi:tetratricopeptide (TPR) repeat protein
MEKKSHKMTRIHITALSLFFLSSAALSQDAALANKNVGQDLIGTVKADQSSIDKIVTDYEQPRGEEIERLFVMYDDARAAGLLEEADVIGKQIVETSIRNYGHESRHTADALTNLANLQIASEENEAAIQNFTAAVEILERTDSRLSKDLIKPLKAMGTAQLRAGRIDRAVSTWSRALHISHVNYGPHDYGQVETLYDLARVYSRAGMNKEADRIWKRIYYLRERSMRAGT